MSVVVLFVPRFHTNLSHWVQGLLQGGFAPQVWTLYSGHSESYEAVAPRQIGYSGVWRMLFRRRRLDPYDSFSMRWGLPALRRVWRGMRTDPPPAVVIIRNINSTSGLVVLAAAVLGSRARIVLYSLGPKYRAALSVRRRFMYRATALALRAVWLTPVRGRESCVETDPAVYYVPFAHPPCVDAGEVRRRRCAPPRVLVVGKFVPRKNHHLFLRAFAEVRRTIDIRALIVGEASLVAHREYYESLREFTTTAGLDDDVEFRLNLPASAMSAVYREADLLVLPATAERAGFVVLEAMAFGLPVICSVTCGLACYVEPGVSGDVFRDGDGSHLQAVLEAWCKDPGRLRRGGLVALELCKERHAPGRLAQFVRDVVAGVRPFGEVGEPQRYAEREGHRP